MAGVFYADGTYNAEIMDLAFDEKKNEETQVVKTQIVLKVKILQQYDLATGDWLPCQAQYDRTIWLSIPDEEEHRKYVVMKLREAGWKGDKFENLREDLISQNCNVTNKARLAKNGKYVGQMVEGWDLPLPQRESTPLENKPQVAKRLNALFGKILKEDQPAKVPAAQPETVPPGDGEPADSDVPF